MLQKRTLRPLAQIAKPQLATALKGAGFSVYEIITHWEAIIGTQFAPFTQPLKIKFPQKTEGKGTPEAGTLYLLCESSFILEVQHSKNLILERVNSYFGWRSLSQIRISQGTVRRAAERPDFSPLPREEARIAAQMGSYENKELEAALKSFGSHILAKKRVML
jgi:hypothetical protein